MKRILFLLLFFILFLKNVEAQTHNRSISFNPQRAIFAAVPTNFPPLKLILTYKQKISSENNIWFSSSIFHYNYNLNVEKLYREVGQIENNMPITKLFFSKPTVSGIRLGMSYRNIIKENKVFFEYGADIAVCNRHINETYDAFGVDIGLLDLGYAYYSDYYIIGEFQNRKYNQFFIGTTTYLNLSFRLRDRIWFEIPLEIQFLFEKNDKNKLTLKPFRANIPLSFSYYF